MNFDILDNNEPWINDPDSLDFNADKKAQELIS
jgi:hypothetical protein